jgi:hypothetical protein
MAKKNTYNPQLFLERFGTAGLDYLEHIYSFRKEIVKLRYGLDNYPVLNIRQIGEKFNWTNDRVKVRLTQIERELRSYERRHKKILKICYLEWKICVFSVNVLLKYQPLFVEFQEEYLRCYDTPLKNISIEKATRVYLEKSNFRKLGDLLERRSWYVGAVEGINKKRMNEIKERLMHFTIPALDKPESL